MIHLNIYNFVTPSFVTSYFAVRIVTNSSAAVGCTACTGGTCNARQCIFQMVLSGNARGRSKGTATAVHVIARRMRFAAI